MAYLREWLKTITALVIILGFLETVLPEAGGVKKFAKLVFGLVLMAAVLQPALQLVMLDWTTAVPTFDGATAEEGWLKTAERLQVTGAAPLLAAAGQSVAVHLQTILLAVEGVESVEVQIAPGRDQIGEVTVAVQGDGRAGSRVKKIAAHYLQIPEEQVTVVIDAGREAVE